VIVLKNILVATDFSPPSEAAIVYGRALARTFGATLHLVHVIENLFLTPMVADPHEIKVTRTRALQHHLTDEDRKVLRASVVMVVSDSPPDAIIDYAKTANIDLIVIGTHGRSAMSQLLVGSVAERVVRTAPCPVLTVRHPEHEFVVPDLPEKRGCHDCSQEDSRRH
jgi:nucleotide-binding universal stress UspA family protein